MLTAVAALLAAVSPPPIAMAPSVVILRPAPNGAAIHSAAVPVIAAVRAPSVRASIDGTPLRTIRTRCNEQVVTLSVPTRALRNGPHLVVLAAGGHRDGAVFTLDRSLPVKAPGAVERAATPTPFACLTRDRIVLQPGRHLDPRKVMVSLDGTAVATSARAIALRRLPDGTWSYHVPGSAHGHVLVLRIGSDWGALARDDARLLALDPPSDEANASAATIGPTGGVVTVTTAAGVTATLEVPPAALSQPTAIRLVPLTQQPLIGAAPAPAFRFEPDGLVFARPAVLLVRFPDGTPPPDGSVQLVTSPLSGLPLMRSTDSARGTVAVLIDHFSEISFVDLADTEHYADLKYIVEPILVHLHHTTLTDLEHAAAVESAREQQGCDGCGSDGGGAPLFTALEESLNTAITYQCPLDAAEPSDAALQHWKVVLDFIGRWTTSDASLARTCVGGVLTSLIEDPELRLSHYEDARGWLVHATARLAELDKEAHDLGFSELEALAGEIIQNGLQQAYTEAKAKCGRDPVDAQDLLRTIGADARNVIGGDSDIARSSDAAAVGCVPAPPPPPQPQPAAPAQPPVPPQVVSAAGCDADVAAPTLARLDHWSDVAASATVNADIGAVLACERRLIAALAVADAHTAASTHTNADYEALAALADRAQSLQAVDVHPLSALDTILRDQLGGASSVCATDSAAGLAQIQQVRSWAARVSSVDSTLAADADTARTGCHTLDCAAAIVAPTDAAAAQWYATEQAAPAGQNRDDAAACVSAILGALIDTAFADAVDFTDRHLQRLLDLSYTAGDDGAAAQQTRALQKLDQRARGLFTDATSRCSIDQAGARLDLKRLQNRWARLVATPDAALAGDVVAALSGVCALPPFAPTARWSGPADWWDGNGNQRSFPPGDPNYSAYTAEETATIVVGSTNPDGTVNVRVSTFTTTGASIGENFFGSQSAGGTAFVLTVGSAAVSGTSTGYTRCFQYPTPSCTDFAMPRTLTATLVNGVLHGRIEPLQGPGTGYLEFTLRQEP